MEPRWIVRMLRQGHRLLTSLAICTAITASIGCGGVPLAAIPRLAQLSGQLLDADPAQFMLALQVDARVQPPAAAVPHLHLVVKPKVAGAFDPVDKKLPLALSTATVATSGLAAPGPGRRWLIYSLPPATQVELQKVQALMRQAQALPSAQRGGSLAMGVEQKDLAITDPALSRTRWSTWMQLKRSEGFFEVWNGTPEDLRRMAESKQ